MKALVDISKNNWLQEIPTKWDVFRIKNLFRLSQEKNQGEDLPVLSLARSGIRTRDISTNEGQLAESYENYTRIRPDDLVFNPMDLRSGAIDLSTYDGVISLAYSVLRKRSGVNIHLKYFKYYFQWHYLDEIFFPFGQGVSADHRWTLKDNILLNFPVLFPPLETQKRIAEFLDEKTKIIDELIAKKEKLIELLREKRAALITHAVTKGLDPNAKLKPSGIDWLGDIPEEWEVKRIKFVARLYTGNSISDDRKPEFLVENDGYPYISSKDIDVNYSSIDYENGMYIPKNSKEFNVAPSGSILLCVEGGSAGRKIAHTDREVCFVNKLCCVTSKNMNNRFIFYFCRSKNFQDHFEVNISGLIGGVSISRLKDFFCLQPIKVEQEQIADFLDAETGRIDKVVKLIESQTEKLKEYRSSLIYHAVTGKIKI